MNRSMQVSLMGLVIFFMAFLDVHAGRPLATDDAGLVDLNMLELESGYTYVQMDEDITEQDVEIALGYGLSRRMDVTLGLDYGIDPESGLGGAELEAKFALFEETENMPAVSFTFAFELGDMGYTLNGIVTKEFGPLAVHANLGYEATGVPVDEGTTTYSGAFEYQAMDRVTFVGELVGASAEGTHSLETLIGADLQVLDPLVLDFGFDKGLNDASSDWMITTGLTLDF